MFYMTKCKIYVQELADFCTSWPFLFYEITKIQNYALCWMCGGSSCDNMVAGGISVKMSFQQFLR